MQPCATHLGQGLQDQSGLGSIPVLLVSLSFQSHLLSLCLSHRFNGGGLCLADEADFLGLCLGRQHLLCPGGRGGQKQDCSVFSVHYH